MTEIQTIDVAIVGGGFTGAAVAFHLTHFKPTASIAVFEPRDFLGGGLAYDNTDPSHRINVPAGRMSLIPGDERHFARWLAETGTNDGDTDVAGRDGFLYPRRGVFGRYVASHLDPLIADERVTHVRAKVVSVEADGRYWKITAAGGRTFQARIIVLATTHPAPDAPRALTKIVADPRVVADPTAQDALDGIKSDARVVVIGTGLTMADLIASLDRQGHRGPIVAVSRRGLRSRGHPRESAEPFGDFQEPASGAAALLRHVRRTIREAEAEGLSWHSVIDAVRRDAQTFWPKLSAGTQSQIVRHLRVYWDVHRFRIAPQVEDVLERRIADGSLKILSASIVEAGAQASHIDIIARHRKHGSSETLTADHVVVTTGPAHARILSSQPYLAHLSAEGRITADHLGLGIACDERSRALDDKRQPAATLLIAGPLARARFGELMGLPQVSAHALAVAKEASCYLYAEASAREVVGAD